jgi:3-hydroxyisobutyrate dehydrogenase-like beta-hydroxyacid dehydrogenase
MHSFILPATVVGVIGYGEVGKIFAAALRAAGAQDVAAWDLSFAAAPHGQAQQAHADRAGVRACRSMAELMKRCDLVFSAVTASQTAAAAAEAAAHIQPGAVFVDLNSASPGTKTQCATRVEAAGGRYVEAAVMASVPPHGLKVPMLLGGPHAQRLAPALRHWGMDAQAVSEQLGVASAIKMCRSVIVKGMEAIVVESFTAARAYGAEDALLASLKETFPGLDWDKQASYFFERAIQHGQRRSEEMIESAATMNDAGIGGHMAAAAAQRQAWVAALARQGAFACPLGGWRARADAALAAVGTTPGSALAATAGGGTPTRPPKAATAAPEAFTTPGAKLTPQPD